MLGEVFQLSDLERQKKLLVAESELNRCLLQKELEKLKTTMGATVAAGVVIDLLAPKPNAWQSHKKRPIWQTLAIAGWSLYRKLRR